MADDLDSIISPLQSAGIDANDPRALALFKNLQGGGVGQPSTDNPASTPPPRVASAPAPPPQPPTSGTTPAAVTPTGRPSGPNLEEQSAQRAYENMSAVPSVSDQMSKVAAAQTARDSAQAKLDSNLRDENGKLLQQYRPSVGQRIWRGARGALEGLAFGGIPGAIRGAVAPQIYPGDSAYGAPNDAGQQELRRERGAVTSANQSLAELGQNFKTAQEAAKNSATGYKDVADTAKAGEGAQDKPATTAEGFVIQTARTLYPNDLAEQQKYINENNGSKEGKHATTPEGVVADAAYTKFPNDPDARVKYMQQNGIVSPDTAARIAEAQAAHADVMANAAARHDDAMANQENNHFMRYQSQLIKYGQDKQNLDTKAQGEWDKVQRDYDRDRAKLDSSDAGQKDYANLDTKYNTRKQQLQTNIDGWYGELQEPAAPPSMSAPRNNAAPGSPAAPGTNEFRDPNPPGGRPGSPAAVSQTGAPQATAKTTQKVKSGSVIGPAPQGSREGRTGTLPDGTKVVVRNGKVVAL